MYRYPLLFLLHYATVFVALFYGAFLFQSETFLNFAFHLFLISFPPVFAICYSKHTMNNYS